MEGELLDRKGTVASPGFGTAVGRAIGAAGRSTGRVACAAGRRGDFIKIGGFFLEAPSILCRLYDERRPLILLWRRGFALEEVVALASAMLVLSETIGLAGGCSGDADVMDEVAMAAIAGGLGAKLDRQSITRRNGS